ncbi:MAG: nucleotidyltransferase domain-containing protein [Nitrospirae bacterium]|nr:nucleotidyltransferase domain-containing protein [Nitrospirota bacterium]
MAKKRIKEAVTYLRDLLYEKGLEINKIILFGSHARGNYTKDSDIDIVVISRNFSGKDTFERAKMLGDTEWRLIKKYLFPFDIVTMSPEEFKKGVSSVSRFARGGKVVYSK